MTPPNDWGIKKCLRLSMAVLLAMLGLVELATLGFDIPVLRQIVGFIFLTFIPGILILRILRVHNVVMIKSLLYSVGLSVAFIYLVGLFNNSVLPFMGISKPISTFPVMATLAIFTLILGAVAYERDRNFSPARPITHFNIRGIFPLPYLLLIFLPILAILGTHLVNAYHDNRVLLLLLALIACVVALAAFDRLPKNAYPLAITMIAISLLFQQSLISPALLGSDISSEYYFQYIVLQNGYWDATIPNNLNTCLSIVFLCPMYSLMLSMDAIWVFKIIYPLLFSLMPLALFHIFQEQIGAKKAFLAAFFFVSTPALITVLTCVARQGIAAIFFALLILLMVDRRLSHLQKSALVIAFVISVPLSHYGLTYICIALFGIGWLFLLLTKNPKVSHLWGRLSRRFSPLSANPGSNVLTEEVSRYSLLNGTLISLLIVFGLTWYMYTASGSAFDNIVGIGNHVYGSLSEFFEPMARESIVGAGLGYGFWQATSLSKVFSILQYITELFIVVGFLAMLFRPKRFKFRPEFIALTVGMALLLLANIVVPQLSTPFGFTRFYQISLFLLAPLCILGGEAVWRGAAKLFKFVPGLKVKQWLALPTKGEKLPTEPTCHSESLTSHRGESQAKQSDGAGGDKTDNSIFLRFFVLAILIPYFLFTSGFVYAFSSQPASVALGPYEMDWWPGVYNQEEVDAANWLSENLPDNSIVYSDFYGATLLGQQLYGRVGTISPSGEIPDNAYIFLRTWNIEHEEVCVRISNEYVHIHLINRPVLAERLANSKVIYDNGAARVLAPID